ncbi:MAG: hypothetical protein AAF581_13745 [Planctomycetota bacterium]
MTGRVGSLLLLLLLCSGCAFVRWSTSTHRDYDYWGHLTIGAAQQSGASIAIPVDVDPLAGEMWMDSGQQIWDAPAVVEGGKIFFHIRTCAAPATKAKPLEIHLSGLAPGTYQVAYRGPEDLVHPLGEITVAD